MELIYWLQKNTHKSVNPNTMCMLKIIVSLSATLANSSKYNLSKITKDISACIAISA